MTSYPFDRNLMTELELLDYYLDAISYRDTHKDQSVAIAMHVFEKTHQDLRLSFPIGDDIIAIRYELGALEAPGMPPNDWQDLNDYHDQIWQRLSALVKEAKKKRTV